MKLSLIISYVLVSFLLAGTSAHAQEGDPSNQTYQKSAYDSVNLATGQVQIRNSLFSLPQRGNLKLSYSLPIFGPQYQISSYNIYGLSWLQAERINEGTNESGTGIWRDQAWGFGLGGSESPDYALLPFGYQWLEAYDQAGSTHVLYDDLQHPGTYHSIDGSGLAGTLTSSDPLIGTITDADGVLNSFVTSYNPQYETSTWVERDPSGNAITSASAITIATVVPTAVQDTVGRIFLEPQGYPNPGPPSQSCPSLSATNQPLLGSETWTVPGANGTQANYIICYSQIYVNTDLVTSEAQQDAILGVEVQAPYVVIQSVVLPNGTYWSFLYDSTDSSYSSVAYGSLVKMGLPSGGSISYQYQKSDPEEIAIGNVFNLYALKSRTIDSGNGNPTTWTYSYAQTSNPFYVTGETVTVSGPNDIVITFIEAPDTVYSFAGGSPPANLIESDRIVYAGRAGNSAALSETSTSYQSLAISTPLNGGLSSSAFPVLPSTVSKKLNGVLQSVETRNYDSGFQGVRDICWYNTDCTPQGPPSQISLGRVIDDTITDGNGRVLRDDQTQYVWQTALGTGYYGSNFLNLPVSRSTYGPSVYSPTSYGPVSLATQTTYKYDEANGSPQGLFGNQTSMQRWLNTGGTISTSTVFNSSGMASAEYDANGNATTIGYDCNNTLPSVITNALGQVTTTLHDCNSGMPTSVQNPNDAAANRPGTAYIYDNAGYLQDIVYPDDGSTSFNYHSYAAPLHVSTSKAQDAKTTLNSDTYYDGLGRVTSQTDASGAAVDTYYDTSGNVASVTNPHFPLDPVYITSFGYDSLGRKTIQCNQDNGSNTPCLAGASFEQWSYSGLTASFTDEVGNSRQQVADGLGRLLSVTETTGAVTNYSYDAPGNLLNVTQNGLAGETPRTRSFTYDSLSRLITASNPESGLICYGIWNGPGCTGGYDSNGNLQFKTDARGLQSTYQYDALNRLTSKTYTNDPANTPASTFWYDGQVQPGTANYPLSNTIGRLSMDKAGPGTGRQYSYDAMGRIVLEPVCTLGDCTYGTGVIGQYDLAGNLTYLIHPSRFSLSQSYGSAGRLSTSSSVPFDDQSPAAQTLLEGMTYYPDGTVNTMTLGNGVVQTFGENNRLQVSSIVDASPLPPFSTSQPFLSQTYSYTNPAGGGANNGNIWSITDKLNGNMSQGLTYDSLNRIRSFALGTATPQQYTIDSFGNASLPIIFNNGDNFTPLNPDTHNRFPVMPVSASLPAGTNLYDASGNLLYDLNGDEAVRQYTWDAENRINSVSLSNNTPYETYGYQADGTRAWKQGANGSGSQYFTWNGELISEYDQGPGWVDYVTVNGQKIARTENYPTILRLSGSIPTTAANFYGPPFNPAPGDPVRSQVIAGDHVVFRQRGSVGACGGISMTFTDYSQNSGNASAGDQYGPTNDACSTSATQWMDRVFDLSQFVGKTPLTINAGEELNTASGPFTIDFSDIAYVRADGTVIPIYNGGSSNPFAAYLGYDPGETDNRDFSAIAMYDSDPTTGTRFYLNNHLGSASLEMSSGGWPVASSHFAPFGGEINAPLSTNVYKFTGKERDAESGLDNFDARYYGSNMGRFMSPDPSGLSFADLGNPQSLNLYSYVVNNPLRYTDPTGLTCQINSTDGIVYDDNDGQDCATVDQQEADHQKNDPASATAYAGLNVTPLQTQSASYTGLLVGSMNAPNNTAKKVACAAKYGQAHSIGAAFGGGTVANFLGGNAVSSLLNLGLAATGNGPSPDPGRTALSGPFFGVPVNDALRLAGRSTIPGAGSFSGAVRTAGLTGIFNAATESGGITSIAAGGELAVQGGLTAGEFASGVGLAKFGFDALTVGYGYFFACSK